MKKSYKYIKSIKFTLMYNLYNKYSSIVSWLERVTGVVHGL